MTTALPPPVDDFADPHDPGLFPTPSGEQLAVVAERGQRRRFTSGQLLFEHGQRDAPFFVLESGAVDFLDRRHDGDRYFARALPGTFIGDVAILTGEATVAAAVAAGEVSVIELDQSGLRRVVAERGDRRSRPADDDGPSRRAGWPVRTSWSWGQATRPARRSSTSPVTPPR